MDAKLIQWTPSLGTGILWQDMQHRTLIDQINALHNAIRAKKGAGQIDPLIAFLDSYVVHHFSIEEKYMDRYRDPEMAHHVAQHTSFAKNLAELKTYRPAQGELAAESLCYDLYEWFKNHILSIDKRLGEFLKAIGEK
ncbi:MAG: bacteriohemerythrin [Desulfobacterota bacterium]|nr:bacteriohemerythrin [Thermodesulfobacteriota bacterium]